MQKIFIIFLLFSQIAAYAQYKNSIFLGGGVAYNNNNKNETGINIRTSTFTASPNVGYFLNDNLVIGAGYEYFYQKKTFSSFIPNDTEVLNNTGQGFNLFLRYYWMFDTKIGLISTLQGNFLFGNTFDDKVSQSSTYRKQHVSLMPGLVFFPANRIGIEININLLNYTFYTEKPTTNSNPNISAQTDESFSLIGNSLLPLGQIGFRYHFLKK